MLEKLHHQRDGAASVVGRSYDVVAPVTSKQKEELYNVKFKLLV
jgi:hypothetical protein